MIPLQSREYIRTNRSLGEFVAERGEKVGDVRVAYLSDLIFLPKQVK